MVKEDEFSNFIFDELESESDGWCSRYDYGEVMKAMRYAYNLAISNMKDNYMSITTRESIDNFLIKQDKDEL